MVFVIFGSGSTIFTNVKDYKQQAKTQWLNQSKGLYIDNQAHRWFKLGFCSQNIYKARIKRPILWRNTTSSKPLALLSVKYEGSSIYSIDDNNFKTSWNRIWVYSVGLPPNTYLSRLNDLIMHYAILGCKTHYYPMEHRSLKIHVLLTTKAASGNFVLSNLLRDHEHNQNTCTSTFIS